MKNGFRKFSHAHTHAKQHFRSMIQLPKQRKPGMKNSDAHGQIMMDFSGNPLRYQNAYNRDLARFLKVQQ